MGNFMIDAKNFTWINGAEDDVEDLCLHGDATARIGNTTLEYHATISAAALYLLKTVTENHRINEGNQLLPCCGFFIIANEDLSQVDICGCLNGIDWTVLHEGNQVRLITEDGEEAVVSLEEYRQKVFRFADKIEAYYKACSPKVLPKDEFDRNGYLAFWKEWHRRRYG